MNYDNGPIHRLKSSQGAGGAVRPTSEMGFPGRPASRQWTIRLHAQKLQYRKSTQCLSCGGGTTRADPHYIPVLTSAMRWQRLPDTYCLFSFVRRADHGCASGSIADCKSVHSLRGATSLCA